MSAKTSGHGFRCCACFLTAGFLCDWKMPNGGLCNKAICPDHSEQVGPNKHLCPQHQESWKAYRVAKRESEQGEQHEPGTGIRT